VFEVWKDPGVSPNEDNRSALINTPLQWGADGGAECDNRFNGFPSAEQTVETVQFPHRSSGTPLKWGVNEMSSNRPHSEMRTKDPGANHTLEENLSLPQV
jgi:hypothetical protein